MSSVRAVVKNGCLTLQVPTTLPENTEVELELSDEHLTPEQRSDLSRQLDAAVADYLAGSPRIPAGQVLESLKNLK